MIAARSGFSPPLSFRAKSTFAATDRRSMPGRRRRSAVCHQLAPSSSSAAASTASTRRPGEPFFDPSVSVLRQAALVPEESCVIVIDMQNFNGERNGAEGTALRVADTCEEVFPALAATYDYYDDFRTIHVIVLDNSDRLGNGL